MTKRFNNIDEQDLDQLYDNYWTVHNTVMEQGHSPAAVAAILIAQGLTLYKTFLSPSDYELMVDSISDSRGLVKTIGEQPE